MGFVCYVGGGKQKAQRSDYGVWQTFYYSYSTVQSSFWKVIFIIIHEIFLNTCIAMTLIFMVFLNAFTDIAAPEKH